MSQSPTLLQTAWNDVVTDGFDPERHPEIGTREEALAALSGKRAEDERQKLVREQADQHWRAGERKDSDTAALELHIEQEQRMARWDAQLVMVGGVQMTNAEAQAARQRILDNSEHYISWAKEQGLIRDGEEAAFLETVRRLHELKELERNGQLTAAQREELDELQQSRLGRAVDETTAQAHKVWKNEHHAATEQTAQGDELLDRIEQQSEAPGTCPADEPSFPHREPLTPSFDAACAATEPLDQPRPEPAPDDVPSTPDRTVAASSFAY